MILGLPATQAAALAQQIAARRQTERVEQALTTYAALAAALAGRQGYRALLQWLRGEDETPAEWRAAGIITGEF